MFQLGGQKNGSLCCVTLHAGGIAVAVTSASRPGISDCAFLPAATLKEAYKLLADFVSQHRLKGSACHFVLQPNQYRLLYLDTPLVLEEELSKAARWLVKDLLQYPIDQSAIDVVQIPVRGGQPNKMYVIAAQLDELRQLTDSLHKVGLRVVNINIIELALSALLTLRPESEQGVALLYCDDRVIHLMISQSGVLRMVRDVGEIAHLDSPEGRDRLSLEIQRSLDFYQSYLGDRRPAKVFLAPGFLQLPSAESLFENALSLPVEVLDLTEELPLVASMDKQDIAQCFAVIGQALQSQGTVV